MKKILLFASAMLFSVMSFAGTQEILPSAYDGKGGESGTGGEATATIGDITISSTLAYNKSNEHIREYTGSVITISSSKTITKIEITCTASADAKYGAGKLTADGYSAGTWTGSATSVAFNATAQVRWTKIVVTYDGEGGGETPDTPDTPTEPEEPSEPEEPETPETPGTTELEIPAEAQSWNIPAEAIDVLQAREICAGLANNEKSGTKYYVMGYVKELHSKYHASGMEGYGNATFYMENVKGANSTDDFLAFQVMGKNGEKFTNMDAVAVGDFVVVYGELTNYNGTYETTNKGSAYIWNSTNAAFAGGETPETPDTPVTGTEIKGLKYADAVYVADEEYGSYWSIDLYAGWNEDEQDYVYPELYLETNEAYGKTKLNGTYNLYYAEYLPNADEVIYIEESEDFAGTVTVKQVGEGAQYSFKGHFVAEDGKTYTFDQVLEVTAYEYMGEDEDTGLGIFEDIILSEDGENPDTPDTPDTPNPAEMITCAEASQIAAEENYKGTANVTVYGYVVEVIKEKVDDKTGRNKQSFWMSDTKGGEKQFQAYYAFVPENFFKVGDKVAVTGILQNYKGTIEIADGEAVLLEVTTGVEDVVLNENLMKVIKNGQMYIIRDGKAYNVLGAQVK